MSYAGRVKILPARNDLGRLVMVCCVAAGVGLAGFASVTAMKLSHEALALSEAHARDIEEVRVQVVRCRHDIEFMREMNSERAKLQARRDDSWYLRDSLTRESIFELRLKIDNIEFGVQPLIEQRRASLQR